MPEIAAEFLKAGVNEISEEEYLSLMPVASEE
jgi:hypothetical protein